jgi:hypothetical protein
MATIEEIERYAADLRAAEVRAMRNLAAHLREAVLDLPVESRLAQAFVHRAKTFEEAARQHNICLHGDGELGMLRHDIEEDE